MPESLSDLRIALGGLDATGDFDELAHRVFRYQLRVNPTYRRFLELSGRARPTPSSWREIPCMPIDLFRTHDVRSGSWEAETTFTSSGTTGASASRHPLPSLRAYQATCVRAFEIVVGHQLSKFRLLALLPAYLDREGSGLVAMVQGFLAVCRPGSGFYLHDHAALRQAVAAASSRHEPVLLWGIPYALLDLIEVGELRLPAGSLVVETGGMKGRRRELTRDELHARLSAGLRLADGSPAPILSEYGMTEMSSQAYYLPPVGRFTPAPSLRVAVRDLTDPFAAAPFGKTGAIDVYDLANVATCSFFQTDDLGRVYPDGRFDVLGRQDGARVRGCNLLL